jgi:hypothetical protein
MKRPILIACFVLAAALAGCGTPHPGLSNGSVSACYRAIPAARAVVHEKSATMIGVHRVAADKVRGQLSSNAQMTLAAEDDTTVCTVAFKGTFAPGQVDMAPPAAAGHYALVLVTSRHLHVLGSAVLDQLPHSLGKRTV